MGAAHLIRRFVGSLRPGGPSAADEVWVRTVLRPGEVALWERMPGADRRHAVGVARAVPLELAPAALLHDVGKVVSGFGTLRRVGATLLGMVDRERWGGRVGQYLHHPRLGGQLLAEVGSDDLTVAWAREHHLPPDRWTVPPEAGALLKAADDD